MEEEMREGMLGWRRVGIKVQRFIERMIIKLWVCAKGRVGDEFGLRGEDQVQEGLEGK